MTLNKLTDEDISIVLEKAIKKCLKIEGVTIKKKNEYDVYTNFEAEDTFMDLLEAFKDMVECDIKINKEVEEFNEELKGEVK